MPEESDPLNSCPTCGSRIPDAAPGGLCPSCILKESQPAQQPSNAPAVDEIASAFPELEAIELIGRGGMGAVYRARQPALDREIALKVLLPDMASDPAFAERFTREARTLAKLNHPNIVALYDFGEREGFYFLSMELVDGVNLRQAMQAGRFTPEQALAVIPGICHALEAAHDLGILHRDIKPENILLDRDGEVKIVDFGIARMAGDPASHFTLTEEGAMLGSSQYMAPEQLERAQSIDHRADIYSLGVVFYEMLTGELPIGRFLPPSEKSQANATIDEIVMRTLEKELDRRFQDVVQVRTEVQAANRSPSDSPASKGSGKDRASGLINGIPGITLGAVTVSAIGVVLAGTFGVLADGLPMKVVLFPIVLGLILILLGYAGCWLALGAMRRGAISPVGRDWLQFLAVAIPIGLVGWASAFASAEWFHRLGKGCLYWTILLSAIPTCLVALLACTGAGVNPSPQWRRRLGGVVAILAIAILTFAFFKDGRWPYAHLLLRGEIVFHPLETESDRQAIRDAIPLAVGDYPDRYLLWFDEAADALEISVLHGDRRQSEVSKHIESLTLRLLDSMPAPLVERAAFSWKPRLSSNDPYGTYGPLFLVGLLSAIGGATTGLLGARAVKISLPTLVALTGILSIPTLPPSVNGIPYLEAPPLPPLELPAIELDFTSPESAALTLMEATIRKDKETMRRAFSREWSDEAFLQRSEELMRSFYETSRVLGIGKVKKGPDGLVEVRVEVVRRDGNGTGRMSTAFEREDGEWKVSVPR